MSLPPSSLLTKPGCKGWNMLECCDVDADMIMRG
jgi:hypothetical protein